MTDSIKDIIEEVMSVRGGEHSAWIFDKEGKIKDDVCCVDIIPLLEDIEQTSVIIPLDELEYNEEYFYDNYDVADNTYNYNCNISNDICFFTVNDYTLVKIHLCGDARGNYSDAFVIYNDGIKNFFEYISRNFDDDLLGFKELNEEYNVSYYALSEDIEIYNNEGEYITTVYEIERDEILKEIGGQKYEN